AALVLRATLFPTRRSSDLVWVVVSPLFHGVFTRFMQLQAGGAAVYADDWRLWTSPNFTDLLAQPLLLAWDVLFTGYYPVISFFRSEEHTAELKSRLLAHRR